MDSEMKDIRLEDLVPFKGHTGQAYEGDCLQQLMDSIEKTGLISPIMALELFFNSNLNQHFPGLELFAAIRSSQIYRDAYQRNFKTGKAY